MNMRTLLTFGIIAAALTIVALYSLIPVPNPGCQLTEPYLGDPVKGLPVPVRLYCVGSTEVWIAKYDVMHADSFPLDLDAIAFSAKENLGGPINPYSVDGLVWRRMCEEDDVKEVCATNYQEARDRLANERESPVHGESWVAAMPMEWQQAFSDKLGWPKTLIVAGIEAVKGNEARTSPADITEGLINLCRETTNVNHLGITIIGAGAASKEATGTAKIGDDGALRAILSGVNEAALQGGCAAKVTLLLWPGRSASAMVRGATGLSVSGDNAKEWTPKGQSLANMMREAKSWLKVSEPWDQRTRYTLGIQTAAVVLCVLLAAVFVTYRGIKVTLPAIAAQVTPLALLAAGVQLGQSSLQIQPLQLLPFILVLAAGLFVPIFAWMKLGDLDKTDDDSV